MKRIIQSLLAVCAVMALAVVPVVASTTSVSATPQEEICKGSGGDWVGDKCTNKNAPANDLSGFIKNIINTILYVLGAIAVIMIIIGGIRYVTSGGDAAGVKGAKDTILYAIVGLVVAIMAYAIVNFVVMNVK